jgi:hypothetical protein
MQNERVRRFRNFTLEHMGILKLENKRIETTTGRFSLSSIDLEKLNVVFKIKCRLCYNKKNIKTRINTI